MMSGPCFCMVLEGINAIKNWRLFIGPTSVITAKQTAPNSLRAKYGDEVDSSKNTCHGSDSETSANREINFIFPELCPDPKKISHIFYTGIGRSDTYEHTEQDFIDRMNKYAHDFNEPVPQNYKNFTLDEWVEWAGADIIYEENGEHKENSQNL